MVREAFHPDRDETEIRDRIPLRQLLVLGVATSVDALAVGVSLAFIEVAIARAVLAIGIITFVITLAGVHLGHRAGLRFRTPAEVAGGVNLILIGTRILFDHLGLL